MKSWAWTRAHDSEGQDVVFEPAVVYGVDFSGARLAGRTTWVARLAAGERPVLECLDRLDAVCGSAERVVALDALVGMIRASDAALWALDFPFEMPVEVMAEGARWGDQFAFLAEWGEDGNGAGLECLRRGNGHVRRATDREVQAPFDPYHYRTIARPPLHLSPLTGQGLRHRTGCTVRTKRLG